MQTDEILKHLTIGDLPESMGLYIDLFKQESVDAVKAEKYCTGDGLDFIRYLIKYSDGITIKTPQLRKMKPLLLRYIRQRLSECHDIHVNRLSHETGLSEKTVLEYLKEINN